MPRGTFERIKVIAYITGTIDQSFIGATTFAHGRTNIRIFHNARPAAATGHYPHLLPWRCFSYYLVTAIGILVYAISDECRIGGLDQCIIHAHDYLIPRSFISSNIPCLTNAGYIPPFPSGATPTMLAFRVSFCHRALMPGRNGRR